MLRRTVDLHELGLQVEIERWKRSVLMSNFKSWKERLDDKADSERSTCCVSFEIASHQAVNKRTAELGYKVLRCPLYNSKSSYND